MKRREFLTALIAITLTWPFAARAQQSTNPVIGFLSNGSPETIGSSLNHFRQGLSEVGFAEGRNVSIEYRWARGRIDQFPNMWDELLQRQLDVVVSVGPGSMLNSRFATSSVPVVHMFGGDPIHAGLVTSLSRPDGQITGVYMLTVTLDPKRFDLLSQIAPIGRPIAVLINRGDDRPTYLETLKQVESAAQAAGRQLIMVSASSEDEIAPAFEAIVQQNAGALLQTGSPFFSSQRDRLIELARHYGIPAAWEFPSFVSRGGLMAYGPDMPAVYRRMGVYAGKILRGTKPADLPIELPTKYVLSLNLKTAKALDIVLPPTLLATADEVIE